MGTKEIPLIHFSKEQTTIPTVKHPQKRCLTPLFFPIPSLPLRASVFTIHFSKEQNQNPIIHHHLYRCLSLFVKEQTTITNRRTSL